MYCQKCRMHGMDGVYCGHCGSRTVFSKFPCPHCKAPNFVSVKFCEHCGRPIQEEAKSFVDEQMKEELK